MPLVAEPLMDSVPVPVNVSEPTPASTAPWKVIDPLPAIPHAPVPASVG